MRLNYFEEAYKDAMKDVMDLCDSLETLKKSNEELTKENQKLKQEIDLLKKELTSIKLTLEEAGENCASWLV